MARRQPDIRKLATRQRWIIWLVAAGLITYILPAFMVWIPPGAFELLFIVFALIRVAVWIGMLIGAILIMTSDGTRPVIIVLAAILMLAPCVNLIVLLLINLGTTGTLRRAGIRVGIMGANAADVERVVNPELCTGCGYSLMGNESGRCPECGLAVDLKYCVGCGKQLRADTSDTCPECGVTT